MASPHSIEHHATGVEQLGDADVLQLGESLEAVDVEVVERQPALVVTGQGEGRAGDLVVDPEPGAEPLGERGLARAQLAGEQDQVAGRGESATAARRGLRVASTPVGPGAQDHGAETTAGRVVGAVSRRAWRWPPRPRR